MDAPRIQYAKTSDGVNIAYYAIGEGPQLMVAPMFAASIQDEWEFPEWRAWYEALARNLTLIRFDARGQGLSDVAADYSVASQALDVQAVADALKLEGFALLGANHSGPACISYALGHPERISGLLLWCTYAKAED